MSYAILAYYQLDPIEDPHAEIARHLDFFQGRDVSSRIYISEQGINGQLCAIQKDAQEYMSWMHARLEFQSLHFKIHTYHEHVFPRLTVKYRPKLVGYDQPIDLSERGEHVSPEHWRDMLAHRDSNSLLIDVRNKYEWQLGRFEGAEVPPCETFREFDAYADQLKEQVDPKTTPVMMYCTGGIRCELYSSVLMKHGFEKVYQLQGGIINYGQQAGSDHWLGKLFVFDDRLSVPITDEETPVIGSCHHCQSPIENYYNCANMDCNELFLCCQPCLEQFAGCCQETCQQAPRLRPYHHQDPHKPFRRWHHYFATKMHN